MYIMAGSCALQPQKVCSIFFFFNPSLDIDTKPTLLILFCGGQPQLRLLSVNRSHVMHLQAPKAKCKTWL